MVQLNMKKCPRCDLTKSVESFYADGSRKDGLSPYCKDCKRSLRLQHKKDNPEKNRKAYLKWRRANPEAAREIARRYSYSNRAPKRPPYPKDAYLMLVELFGERCLACGAKENITIDHIVPLSKGGGSQMDNLQLLCKSCNCSKQARTVDYRFE